MDMLLVFAQEQAGNDISICGEFIPAHRADARRAGPLLLWIAVTAPVNVGYRIVSLLPSVVSVLGGD